MAIAEGARRAIHSLRPRGSATAGRAAGTNSRRKPATLVGCPQMAARLPFYNISSTQLLVWGILGLAFVAAAPGVGAVDGEAGRMRNSKIALSVSKEGRLLSVDNRLAQEELISEANQVTNNAIGPHHETRSRLSGVLRHGLLFAVRLGSQCRADHSMTPSSLP